MYSVTNGLTQGNFTLLNVLKDGIMTDILTITGNGGNGVTDLSAYSTTAATASLLDAKIDDTQVLTNVPVGAIFTDTVTSPLILTLDGSTQAVTTLNFIGNNSSVDNGVLSVSRMAWQDKVVLRFGGASTDKDLVQDASGFLIWDGGIMTSNAYLVTVLQAYATTASLTNALTDYDTTTEVASAISTGLAGKISTSHECAKISTAAVDFGAFGITARRLSIDSIIGTTLYILNDGLGHLTLEGGVGGSGDILVTVSSMITQLLAHVTISSLTTQLALKVDSSDLVTYANGVEALLVDKEDVLSNYAETTGAIVVIVQTDDTGSPGLHLNWTGWHANVAGSHQVVAVGVHYTFTGVGTGTMYLSIDLQYDDVDHILISILDGNAWATVHELMVVGLNSTWQTITWQFTIPTTNGDTMTLNLGGVPAGSAYTQGAGAVRIRNLRLHKNTSTSTISVPLTCSENVVCDRTISATSFVSTSDASVKTTILDASIEDCWGVFQAVWPKTYVRSDIGGGTRLGFIAQDVNNSLPEEFQNLVGRKYGGAEPMLQLDYSRLVAVLWGACKRLEDRIIALEA